MSELKPILDAIKELIVEVMEEAEVDSVISGDTTDLERNRETAENLYKQAEELEEE